MFNVYKKKPLLCRTKGAVLFRRWLKYLMNMKTDTQCLMKEFLYSATQNTHTHFQQANSSLCVCTSCHSHDVSNPPTSTCVRRGFQLSHNFSCPLPFWQCVCVRWQYSTRVELRITSEIKQNQNLPVLVCKLCSALLLLFSPVGNVRPRCSDWFILHL